MCCFLGKHRAQLWTAVIDPQGIWAGGENGEERKLARSVEECDSLQGWMAFSEKTASLAEKTDRRKGCEQRQARKEEERWPGCSFLLVSEGRKLSHVDCNTVWSPKRGLRDFWTRSKPIPLESSEWIGLVVCLWWWRFQSGLIECAAEGFRLGVQTVENLLAE